MKVAASMKGRVVGGLDLDSVINGAASRILRPLFSRYRDESRHARTDYERLVVAALRDPVLARYLRDEGIAHVQAAPASLPDKIFVLSINQLVNYPRR